MFNKFLSYAAASLVLASCSSTDVLEENIAAGTAISFNSHVSNSSRAMTNDNFTSFRVYGGYTLDGQSDYHTSFNSTEVTKTEGTWSYTGGAKYWVKDASYKFYAYSCENTALQKGTPIFATSGDKAGTFEITAFECDDTHQHDFLFAESGTIIGKESGNTAVSFTFKHVLSKVCAKFKSGFPAGVNIQVTGVQFRNIHDRANFSSTLAADERWISHSRTKAYNETTSEYTKTSLDITGDNTISAAIPAEGGNAAVEAKDVTTNNGFFIPCTYTAAEVYLCFHIKVTDEDGNTIKDEDIKGNIQPTWKPGVSYTYNITVNGTAAGLEKIEFTVDATNGITDWTEQEGGEIKF
ncbi:fimbrillin family protein [Duncaniella freteri]|uniref:fimbrillin family protein n=6 Tax=Duncaniella TaxID=2518495 RepID=UPI00136BC550|nr:fimbrillin family protein [Duncaniella freteri]NBJ07089.1 hypothetical protein [Alistipes sp. Z76]NCE69201.1 hypothetical protein [Muribaculaceae bacterium M3]